MSQNKFRNVVLSEKILGKFFMYQMPGTQANLREELQQMGNIPIDSIFCLTNLKEIKKYSAEYADMIQMTDLESATKDVSVEHIGKLQYQTYSPEITLYGITDMGVPKRIQDFLDFVRSAAIDLLAGRNILVHCRAGKGRTGLFAVCLLRALNYPLNEAFEVVQLKGAAPENEKQKEFIHKIDKLLSVTVPKKKTTKKKN